MNLRIAEINYKSYVDGPGHRSVLFMQGCQHACAGCQSAHTHDPEQGMVRDVEILANEFLGFAKVAQETDNPLLTISGGEPFNQLSGLKYLLWLLKSNAHVIVYTGYTFEELLQINHELKKDTILHIFDMINVLVDGRYDYKQDSQSIQYRGSSNQRVIDLPASRAGVLKLLDWDQPELTIVNGRIIGWGWVKQNRLEGVD